KREKTSGKEKSVGMLSMGASFVPTNVWLIYWRSRSQSNQYQKKICRYVARMMRRNEATKMKPEKGIGVSANGTLIVLFATRSNVSGEPIVVSKQKSATPRSVSMVLFSVSEYCLWASRTTSL